MEHEKAVLLRQIIELSKAGLVSRSVVAQTAMRAEYMAAVSSDNVPSTLAHIMLDKAVSRIGQTAAKTEREIADNTTAQIFDIVGTAEIPNMQADLLVFKNDIVRQLSRDARSISSIFQQFQISLNTVRLDRHALAKASALKSVLDPKTFTYRDKAGKIWDANVYLKTHGSQYYYGLTNDLVEADMREKGQATAILNRPGHTSDGMFVFLENVDREKYFHPGSQAILT